MLLLGILLAGFIQAGEDPREVYQQKMNSVNAGTLPMLTLQMAESFLDVPYVAHTLEGNPEEKLVCRFDALDCTTLVEVSVALALSRQKNLSYEEFLDQLSALRYTKAKPDGYASRQHYFLSWVNQTQTMGLVNDITQSLGGIPYTKEINFMSTHASLYPAINSESIQSQIKANEEEINRKTYHYIPKASVKSIEGKLKDGDIIGITSTIAGLDINHQGIIRMKGNRAYLVHASTTGKKVLVSPVPLSDYLNTVKKHSGIIVLRLTETY